MASSSQSAPGPIKKALFKFFSSNERAGTDKNDEANSSRDGRHMSAPCCKNCNAVDESHVRRVRVCQPKGNSSCRSASISPSSNALKEHYNSEWHDSTSNWSSDEAVCPECQQRNRDMSTCDVRNESGEEQTVWNVASSSKAQQSSLDPVVQIPTNPTILLVVLKWVQFRNRLGLLLIFLTVVNGSRIMVRPVFRHVPFRRSLRFL